ncbi:MAG: hypothetical protein CMN32_01160 [Saprospirales bacterium]|nr:hypothetical protein [Saprospirales bacterium]
MNELKQSIQDKLRNLAKAHGKDFQMILTRYFQERILYRISVSPFTNNFCLKGGALLYAISEEMGRPTLDIDFLAIGIQRDQKKVEAIFRKICSRPYPLDDIEIQADGISVKEIMEHKRYIGIRVKIPISLGNMRQILTIDIGFSDQVVPAPVKMTYPTLLDMEEPVVIAYSSVSVIAEKFEAMIDLGEMNSRMKDFYDVWQLLISGNIDKEDLKKAIKKHSKFAKRL